MDGSAARNQVTRETIRTYFAEKCRTCGRPLRLLMSLLGQRVTCPHCAAPFVACGVDSDLGRLPRRSNLDRAAQLLAEIPTPLPR
ncbi:hypothetical protein [Candidatus Laterigemmans baculatus]|uniref:hypothetical protein n=1 Tax=Candidatus Laterigemmans baculatus TaxID=2770505 RepID=UPI0019400400|nr:hypothetical protein [Candidatus Laterigemmans baculatus]